MALRKHYMTLCMMNDTEVTHIKRKNGIEVTFEQACEGGFKTLVTTITGKALSNKGFDDSEVAWFQDFVKRNASLIIEQSNETDDTLTEDTTTLDSEQAPTVVDRAIIEFLSDGTWRLTSIKMES